METTNINMYKFDKPTKNGEWYIFNNTILDNLNLSDCNSSVTGICENVKTVSDCINICKNSKACSVGYFIETPDRENICVPIKDNKEHKVEPYYRMRNKNIYPVLKNMKTTVFSNFSFPPSHPNNIFYTDILVLTLPSINKSISFEQNTDVLISTKPTHIQFVPREIVKSFASQYIIVKNGDEVVINIPGTAYILRSQENGIVWAMRASTINSVNNTFRIFSADKSKKIGDSLTYSDTIYFTTQDQPVIYTPDLDTLVPAELSINNALEAGLDMIFKIEPKINVYYCDNSICQNTTLENTIRDKDQAMYKGNPVSRSPTCWNLCDKKISSENYVKPEKSSFSTLVPSFSTLVPRLFIILVISLVIGFILFIILKYN